jgi:hypothetical protein
MPRGAFFLSAIHYSRAGAKAFANVEFPLVSGDLSVVPQAD